MDLLGVAWRFKQELSFLAEEALSRYVCRVCRTAEEVDG